MKKVHDRVYARPLDIINDSKIKDVEHRVKCLVTIDSCDLINLATNYLINPKNK